MALHSIWEGEGITVILGTDPPVFANGQRMDGADTLVKTFEASSWAEAMQARNDHYGWGRYVDPEADGSPKGVDRGQ